MFPWPAMEELSLESSRAMPAMSVGAPDQSRSQSLGRRRLPSRPFGAATGLLVLWTVLLVAWRTARIEIVASGARAPLETLGVIALALTCGLAYVRYTVHASDAMLLTVLA